MLRTLQRHEVTEADRRQRDDAVVDGVEVRPALVAGERPSTKRDHQRRHVHRYQNQPGKTHKKLRFRLLKPFREFNYPFKFSKKTQKGNDALWVQIYVVDDDDDDDDYYYYCCYYYDIKTIILNWNEMISS